MLSLHKILTLHKRLYAQLLVCGYFLNVFRSLRCLEILTCSVVSLSIPSDYHWSFGSPLHSKLSLAQVWSTGSAALDCQYVLLPQSKSNCCSKTGGPGRRQNWLQPKLPLLFLFLLTLTPTKSMTTDSNCTSSHWLNTNYWLCYFL